MTEPDPSAAGAAAERITNLIDTARADLAEAEASRCRRRYPRDAEIARLHGITLLQVGRLAEARAALESAHALSPQSIEVLCNLGSVLLANGEAPAAVASLERACALAPQHPAVLNGLGNARRALGDLVGARDAYEQATRAQPDYLGAWFNLGAIRHALGELALAERDVRDALSLAPAHPEGLLVLGHILAAQQRHAEAEAAYAAGARSAPGDARFPYQCGLMAEEQKHHAAAADAHERALALDPHLDHALGQLVFLRRQLCDWRDIEALSTRLRARVGAGAAGIAPFGFLAEAATADEQLRCARTCAAGIEASSAALRARLAFAHPRPTSAAPLRVGFVANGFGNHPTGLLIVAMLEALREEEIEIHAFSTAPADGSPILRRLVAAAHAWHDSANTTAQALASTIHEAGIEVLLDLDGYCSGALPAAFALRPAPVQVNWLAYPGTLGAPWIDYVIADRIVLPDRLDAFFSEQVVALPRCFQPSDPTRVVAEPPSRSACGLPQGTVVYVCFNNSFKINPASFDRMLSVLREVPDSVLWLLSGPGGADQRLRTYAAQHGVGAARLVFMPKLPHAEYLARYRHADLFLDTAPYNAHTTASDAIWAGCPVLTVGGETFAARVAASLNHHLGMPQLNARDDAAFIEFATRIGRDAAARVALRDELATCRQHSNVFDMHGFAADFATALRKMSQRYRAGLAPGPLD
jgi:predicted O-linked N-acetylglucosamine transferase (SPINDLY family)